MHASGYSVQDSEGRAALHMCAMSGNVSLAKRLLATEGGAQQLLLLDKHGRTSLHLAASALSELADGPKTADDSMTGSRGGFRQTRVFKGLGFRV